MSRRALPVLLLTVLLALTGCAQPEEANDNGPEPAPVQPTDVIRDGLPGS